MNTQVEHRQQKSISLAPHQPPSTKHHQNQNAQALKQKKETLEKFAYCNSSQLFQNSTMDLKQFIRINYTRYCELLDKCEDVKQTIQMKQDHLNLINSTTEHRALKACTNQQTVDNIGQMRMAIENQQKLNNELRNELTRCSTLCKQQDFLYEYSQVCKEVEELRAINAQLLKK